MTSDCENDETLDLIMMGQLVEVRTEVCQSCENPHPVFIFRTVGPMGEEMFFELQVPSEPLADGRDTFEEFVEKLATTAAMIREQKKQRQGRKSSPPGEMN